MDDEKKELIKDLLWIIACGIVLCAVFCSNTSKSVRKRENNNLEEGTEIAKKYIDLLKIINSLNVKGIKVDNSQYKESMLSYDGICELIDEYIETSEEETLIKLIIQKDFIEKELVKNGFVYDKETDTWYLELAKGTIYNTNTNKEEVTTETYRYKYNNEYNSINIDYDTNGNIISSSYNTSKVLKRKL